MGKYCRGAASICAETVMRLNDQMTVAQLIDLVTFLNSRYVLMEGYSEVYYQ